MERSHETERLGCLKKVPSPNIGIERFGTKFAPRFQSAHLRFAAEIWRNAILGGGNSNIFYVHPYPWGNDPSKPTFPWRNHRCFSRTWNVWVQLSLKAWLRPWACRAWDKQIDEENVEFWEWLLGVILLLMAEILHKLIGSLSHYLQGFIHPRRCRISSINSTTMMVVSQMEFLCMLILSFWIFFALCTINYIYFF